jgi:23S rRNA (guanosine2251-2'-O)-methyltransferase
MAKKKREERREWLGGVHAVSAVLKARQRRVFRIFRSQESSGGDLRELQAQAEERGIPCSAVSRATIQRALSSGERHERNPNESLARVVAEVSAFPYVDVHAFLEEKGRPSVILACDRVQDPQNLGALLRSYFAFGGMQVVLTARHSCAITPTVSRTSAGAAEYLKIAQVDNLAVTLERFKRHGFWIVATQPKGGHRLSDLPSPPLVLVLGGEQGGVRPGLLKGADLQVGIPICADLESLNVSASAAIFFYEIFRRGVGRAHPIDIKGVFRPESP